MEMEYKNGLMIKNIMENGRIIWMEKGFYKTITEKNMRDISRMVLNMGKEYKFGLTVKNTMEIGQITQWMDREF